MSCVSGCMSAHSYPCMHSQPESVPPLHACIPHLLARRLDEMCECTMTVDRAHAHTTEPLHGCIPHLQIAQ